MADKIIWQNPCNDGKEVQRCVKIAREVGASEEEILRYVLKSEYIQRALVSFISGLSSGVFCVPDDQTPSTQQRLHEEKMSALLDEEKEVLYRIKTLRKHEQEKLALVKKEKQ